MCNSTSDKKTRSPSQAIVKFCKECDGAAVPDVRNCLHKSCPFYEFRLAKALKVEHPDSLTAIKTYCFEECQAGSSRYEVFICAGDTCFLGPCPVYPFRMGKNPNRSKPLSEERRKALVEAGKKYRFQTGHDPSFCAPESSETGLGIVHPDSLKNNTKNDRLTVISGGKEK